MAIAPIDKVKSVLVYATSVIPAGKIMMGATLYGYDWPLPHPQAGRASSISNKSAQNLAIEVQRPIQWDADRASPSFEYTDSDNRDRVVWFEDSLSIAAKLQLIYDYSLRGISYWVLGHEFPQNWHLIRDTFTVKKI